MQKNGGGDCHWDKNWKNEGSGEKNEKSLFAGERNKPQRWGGGGMNNIYPCDKEIKIKTYGGDCGEGEEERIVEIPFPTGGVVQELRFQIIARNSFVFTVQIIARNSFVFKSLLETASFSNHC